MKVIWQQKPVVYTTVFGEQVGSKVQMMKPAMANAHGVTMLQKCSCQCQKRPSSQHEWKPKMAAAGVPITALDDLEQSGAFFKICKMDYPGGPQACPLFTHPSFCKRKLDRVTQDDPRPTQLQLKSRAVIACP